MTASREKDSADFDLEHLIELFDEALTSKDDRVKSALQSLLMMTILTKSESVKSVISDKSQGPLRRLFEDLHHINSRLYRVEDQLQNIAHAFSQNAAAEKEASLNQTYNRYGLGSQISGTVQPAYLDIAKKINSANTLLPKIKKQGI